MTSNGLHTKLNIIKYRLKNIKFTDSYSSLNSIGKTMYIKTKNISKPIGRIHKSHIIAKLNLQKRGKVCNFVFVFTGR